MRNNYYITKISPDEIKVDLMKKTNSNCYFKQPKNSKMFKAMYGHTNKKGEFYINTRDPANSQSCGMGKATSQPKVYYDKKLMDIREKLRPIFNILYDSPVIRHLARFGL